MRGTYKAFIDNDLEPLVENILFVSQLKNVSVRCKAEMVDTTVGDYLDHLWCLALMPGHTESKLLSKAITAAVVQTSRMSGSVNKELVKYRKTRKVKFYENPKQLELIVELFEAGFSDSEISDVTGIEQCHVYCVTGVLGAE